MKVLVTGAAGFIGGEICRQLSEQGADVVKIDNYLPQAHGDRTGDDGIEVRDVRDADDWRHLLRGVDAVCHQAAMVGAGVSVADLPTYAAHNDLGTAALLAAMYAEGVDACVLASSMVVYGEGWYSCESHGRQQPGVRSRTALDAKDFENHCPTCDQPLGWMLVPESARLDPRGAYAASKVAQENYTSSWARQADARAIGLRYHNVYGPHMPRDTPYAGVAAIFRSALEAGQSPRVFEDGGQMRDFVHVEDVARANVLALQAVLERPSDTWSTYNVASGTPVSISNVAEMLGGDPVVTGDYRLGDVRHIVASPHRAADDIGFEASVNPQAGLAKFVTDPMRAPVKAESPTNP